MPEKSPPKYCEAKTRSGTSCKQIAGKRTNHPGVGRCFLHGGCSTGSKSVEGKSKQARSHGLYAKILTQKDRDRLQETQGHSPAKILKENFYLVQSKTLGLIENENKFAQESKTLLRACAVLVENGELSEDFVNNTLRGILKPLDISRLARIYNASANLINASTALESGSLVGQLNIGKNLILNILRNSNDQPTRAKAIATVSEMKLDLGLPVDELAALGQEAEVETETNDKIDTEVACDRGESSQTILSHLAPSVVLIP